MARWWRRARHSRARFPVGVRRSTGPAVGYLASVRNVALHVTRLDDLDAELIAAADRVTGDGRTVMYEFRVSSAQQTAAQRPRQHRGDADPPMSAHEHNR